MNTCSGKVRNLSTTKNSRFFRLLFFPHYRFFRIPTEQVYISSTKTNLAHQIQIPEPGGDSFCQRRFC